MVLWRCWPTCSSSPWILQTTHTKYFLVTLRLLLLHLKSLFPPTTAPLPPTPLKSCPPNLRVWCSPPPTSQAQCPTESLSTNTVHLFASERFNWTPAQACERRPQNSSSVFTLWYDQTERQWGRGWGDRARWGCPTQGAEEREHNLAHTAKHHHGRSPLVLCLFFILLLLLLLFSPVFVKKVLWRHQSASVSGLVACDFEVSFEKEDVEHFRGLWLPCSCIYRTV